MLEGVIRSDGTAFDIAGKGIADPGSIKVALKYTVQLSNIDT